MAAPVAAPKHLRLLRPFVLLAIAAGCTGTTLGFVLLERLQWRPAPFDWSWRQAHGELQVFGFLVPFITGFALFLVPRLAGGKPVEHRRIAQLALRAMGLSALFALAALFASLLGTLVRAPLAK